MNNRDKYIQIFKGVFNVDESALNEGFTFADIREWDSFAHLTLISELEETFDVMFETDDILHFGSFENGMKLLEKYGVSFEA